MIAKYNEREQSEAYRIYMSDLLSVHIKSICGEDADVPRYYDIVHQKTPQKTESPEEIISRFDSLRRK